jgi:hypothetical protein
MTLFSTDAPVGEDLSSDPAQLARARGPVTDDDQIENALFRCSGFAQVVQDISADPNQIEGAPKSAGSTELF